MGKGEEESGRREKHETASGEKKGREQKKKYNGIESKKRSK